MGFSLATINKKWLAVLIVYIVINLVGLGLLIAMGIAEWWKIAVLLVVVVADVLGYHFIVPKLQASTTK